ncbi:hypothetical protein ES703_47101 [subsurface metagenome]
MNNDYKPRREQAMILERAMAHINSVPYAVTARWLFYRLLGEVYQDKGEYHAKFLPLTSKARKRFYNGWRPWTLADDTRGIIPGGGGFDDALEWLGAVKEQEKFIKAKWLSQDHYIEIWFEAKAMRSQFEYYTEEIPLLPFGGDVSISEKWKAAKRLEQAGHQYGLPVVVIYFGDEDEKGFEIERAALADIRQWCSVDFNEFRGGLNLGDGRRFGLAESIDKPGAHQWEALSDEQAGQLITDAVDPYYSKEALADIKGEEAEVTEKFRDKFEDFIADWD